MSMSAHNNTSPPCSSPTPNDPNDAELEPSTTNDSNPSTSSANTSATNKRKTFPRFLVVEGLGANKTLRNVNSTILDKTIDGATSVSTKRGWMGRSVLVEVNHEAYFTNLMKLNQVDDMPVRVSAHRSLNYAKGVVRFRQATEGLTNEDLARDLNMSRRNHDLPQVKDACRVIITKNGKKIQKGTFFLTFDTPTLPDRIFLGFERFDVEPYIPLPRRCFKCQRFGHGARTCRATEDVCPLCSGTGHKQEACPNKESPTCANCKGTHSAASKECPAFITEKRALEIQAESHCTISAAREQAGHDASTEEAAKSYARVVAHSQADLINRNLALSEENARLREVIGTLRQDNASLQQRLDGYEQRLQTLEQSMVGGAHPDTPLVGVPKNTSVGSAHNTTPVGDAHRPPVPKAHMASQTDSGGTAGPHASMPPAQIDRIEGPRDAPSYIPSQSATPHKKVELRRKGPTFIPVTSPMTKPAALRQHRKSHQAKLNKP